MGCAKPPQRCKDAKSIFGKWTTENKEKLTAIAEKSALVWVLRLGIEFLVFGLVAGVRGRFASHGGPAVAVGGVGARRRRFVENGERIA